MKKIITTALSLVLVFAIFALTACGAAPSVVVERALERTENLDSFSATLETKVTMSTLGVNVEMPMTIEYKVEGANSLKPKLYAKSTIVIFGETTTVETYMADGWMYIIQNNNKFKFDISKVDDAESYDYSEFIDDMMQSLPENLLANVEFKAEEDGGKTVTLNIPDAAFKEIFDDFLEEMGELALQDEFDRLTTSNAIVSITVKGDYVSVYDMAYTMTIGSSFASVDANVTAKLTFNNPGDKVSVTLPSDLSSFQDVTASFK